ncbi:MAG: hypothetical protein Q9215_006865 [Flavoplaca cf. flavocitrina]
MEPDFLSKTTHEQQEYLLSNVKDWSILNGLAVRPPAYLFPAGTDLSGALATTAPVTLCPSLFPRACFDEARAIQKAYNELYAAIARDREWLKHIVERLIEVDDFIANLWSVHLEVEKEGYAQNLTLGIFRSDYMIHTDSASPDEKPTIKQVEFNTIASSFGGLSTKVSQLHSYLNSIAAYPLTSPHVVTPTSFPANPCIDSLSLGFSTAHCAYGPSKSSPPLPLCILFIVTVPESNIFDQLALSTPLQTTYGIPTFRLDFRFILDHTSVSADKKRVLIYSPPHSPDSSYEVSLIYFRAGYSPSHYPTQASWDARLQLERSAAIKCPSILTHLAGSKKIQQVLATPNSPHLSNFLSRTSSSDMIERIRNTFTAIYPLDDTPEGQYAVRLATNPKDSGGYVLKPQREGGGNNIYGAKIPEFLRGLGDDQQKWRSYILMELIKPPALRNSIFRNGEVQSGEVIGELGVYGVCLWRNGNDETGGKKGGEGKDGKVVENWEAGFLLRTKGSSSEEGGVAAGFGAVDSPCLIEV